MKINDKLVGDIKAHNILSKDELLSLINKYYSSVGVAYGYRIIASLLESKIVFKLDSNTYSTKEMAEFSYALTENKILKTVGGYGDFSVWDTNILNEWLNHLLNSVITFVEVDKDMVAFVYDALRREGFTNVLLNPNRIEFNKYFDNKMIIVRPIAKSLVERTHNISLERLIMNIYNDKLLTFFYSEDEKINILNEIFNKYQINMDKLFHIARRKKIYDEFLVFLTNNIGSRYLSHNDR